MRAIRLRSATLALVKLFWHIGPHKTGTSSLQLALAAHAASGKALFFYPPTPEVGPGHAAIAWRFLGLNKRQREPDAVLAEVRRVEGEGFSNLVLSSEEFSRALVEDDSFAAFAPVCDQVECELVITLRSLTDRVHPELQELIKHGHKLRFENMPEILAASMNRPGLRPDFLPAAISSSGAASASVILVDPKNPQKLFDGISTILGENIPPSRDPTNNASYPFIKTVWLEAINRYGGLPSNEAREAADAGFFAATRKFGKLSEAQYPPLPPHFQLYLERTWELQLAYLKVLQEAGRIRCL